MDKERLKYIVCPKILWYITGRFIFEKGLDIYAYLTNKEPVWKDADPRYCGKKFCRYCGGTIRNKIQ